MSDYNKLENGSFVDFESAKTFQFDHVNTKPSEWEDYTVDDHVSSTMYPSHIREEMADRCSASISKPLAAYVLEHYPALPAYAVYPPLPTDTDQDSYTVLIVGNKYNNPNYWSAPFPPPVPTPLI